MLRSVSVGIMENGWEGSAGGYRKGLNVAARK